MRLANLGKRLEMQFNEQFPEAQEFLDPNKTLIKMIE